MTTIIADAGLALGLGWNHRKANGRLLLPFVLFLACSAACLTPSGPAQAQEPAPEEDARCDKCHSSRSFLVGKTDTQEGDEALFIPDSLIVDSRHSSLTCATCHPGYDAGYPHRAEQVSVPCSQCHEAIGAEYERSWHSPQLAGEEFAPGCVTCHTAHTVYGMDERRSPIHALNVDRVCSGCHADPAMIERRYSAPEDSVGRRAATRWHETVHGEAQFRSGLQIVATCNDCHSSHSIFPPSEDESTLSRANIAITCAKCHLGIEEVYLEGAHGRALVDGDTLVHTVGDYPGDEGHLAPVCNDCHPGHKLLSDTTAVWRTATVEECGSCHERVYDTYSETYHGKTTRFGNDLVAKCADCHPPHDTRAVNDPLSSVYPLNLVETCGACHPNANANFVKYYAHADPYDRVGYPVVFWARLFMWTLLSSVWIFFAIHTGLWLIRLWIGRRRGERYGLGGGMAEALSASDRGEGPYILRFSLVHRILHAAVIVSFFTLVATGTPLLFPDARWAQAFMSAFGGTGGAGGLHRIAAVITFGYFFGHVIHLTLRIMKSTDRKSFFWGPNTLVWQKKDAQDMAQMFRWFFVKGPQPRFDRWTYMDKFDYWGEMWGIFLIGGTGLLLWFPTIASFFFPGWIFNVATVLHGVEALLAAGFIFSAHFFNIHLRPEKFPVDIVMFTGKATLEYMKDEHPLEYERLQREGRLEELIATPPTETAKKWATVLGMIALAVGLSLIALMLYALLAL
jgi:cytochrome b subunit of formate dehydrogenase/nitrate/TMAO reductase-like tetraheme cytochrome c subunit